MVMISIALVLEHSETIGLGNVSIEEFDIKKDYYFQSDKYQ